MTKLHHFSYIIQNNNLETALEFFEILGCSVAYREGSARWCMIEQKPTPIDIQIIEKDCKPIDIDSKINTHIAFISNKPKNDIERVKSWAKENNIEFRAGAWTDNEFWFDLPQIFQNFVVEIMDKSVIDQ